MHHIYHTHAFILDSENSGEANKFFNLFTREVGAIEASAQGVRLLKSKLRFSLKNFSYSEVSLVRGKTGWKITNAVPILNVYDEFRGHKKKFIVFANISALLKRFLSGEEKNTVLFDTLKDASVFLLKSDLSEKEIDDFETMLVLIILHNLGYVGDSKEFKDIIDKPGWTQVGLSKIRSVRSRAIEEINRSIKESQL